MDLVKNANGLLQQNMPATRLRTPRHLQFQIPLPTEHPRPRPIKMGPLAASPSPQHSKKITH